MSRGASSDQRERDQVFIENQREQLQEEPAQAPSGRKGGLSARCGHPLNRHVSCAGTWEVANVEQGGREGLGFRVWGLGFRV